MQHINRLLHAARKAVQGKGEYIMGFVGYDITQRKYKSTVYLWDGVPGSGYNNIVETLHDTQEAAVDACHAIETQYPNNKDSLVFIEDLSPEESG